MLFFKSSGILFFLFFCIFHSTLGDTFDECEGIADGSFVSSWTSCREYIYCFGDESESGECEQGQYFDGESCDDEANVFCPLDVDPSSPEEPEEPLTTTIATTIATTSEPTTAIPSEATSATTAENGQLSTGTGTTTFEPITIPPKVQDTCPPTDYPNQIVLMPSTESCSDYYLCYHGHPIEMHCTNHLHFNTNSGKCDFPENVQCFNNRPNANKCLPHVTDFFPHPEKCNYFYYCIKGYLTVQQCPFYYGWDIEKRSCVHISEAKCYKNLKKVI